MIDSLDVVLEQMLTYRYLLVFFQDISYHIHCKY